MNEGKKLSWLKEQTLSENYEVIEAKETHPTKDFKLDPSGHYVLIKVLYDQEKIEVSICNSKHEILKTFKGKRPRDIWTAIFSHEEMHSLKWFTRKDHIAYLGKELKKAELALSIGQTGYFQE